MKPNKVKSILSNCNNEIAHLEKEITAAQDRIKLAKEEIAFLKDTQRLYAKKGSFEPKKVQNLPPEGQQVGGKV